MAGVAGRAANGPQTSAHKTTLNHLNATHGKCAWAAHEKVSLAPALGGAGALPILPLTTSEVLPTVLSALTAAGEALD